MQNVWFLALFLLAACGNATTVPTTVYKGELHNTDINAIESIVETTATHWKLRVFKKDREEMKRLSAGKEAFFVALYVRDDPMFVITNVGVPHVLTLTVNGYGHLSTRDVEQITHELMSALSSQLDIHLTTSQ